MSTGRVQGFAALVFAWSRHLAFGLKAAVSEPQIESDGRKTPRVLANLSKAGYLQEEPSPHAKGRVIYVATSKAFDEVTEEQVDVRALTVQALEKASHDHDAKQFCGLTVFGPSEGATKYILTHKDQFDFFLVSQYAPVWDNPERSRPYVLGGQRTDNDYTSNLMVRPKDFPALMAEATHKLRFARLYKTNLAWGLQQQGIIEAVDADVFTAEGGSSRLFTGAASVGFGDDPKGWEKDSKRNVQLMRARIADYTRRCNVLLTVEAKVAAAGGWDKVLAKYAGDLDAAMRKEAAEPETADEGVADSATVQ